MECEAVQRPWGRRIREIGYKRDERERPSCLPPPPDQPSTVKVVSVVMRVPERTVTSMVIR